MRRAAAILLLCVLIVGGALAVASLPGAVRLQAGSLSIEASTPVLVLAALLVLGGFYLIMRLLGGALRLPARLRARAARRARADGDAAVTRALVALAAGHQTDAQTAAARARKRLGDTPQTLLLSAQAARLAGNEAQAAAYYATLADHPEAALLGLRGQLRQAAAREDWAEAEAIAARAERAHPGSAWLREERARLALRAGDWKGALALSGPDAPRTALGAAAATAAEDPAEGLKLARAAWTADPALPPAALAYAARLRAAGNDRKAAGVLAQSWAAHPHPDLGRAALAGIEGGAARLAAARTLTASTATDQESLLLIGQAALDAGDLPAARAATDALAGLDQRRAWMLVAAVEQRIHPDSEAVRRAWQRSAAAGPDPAWRCSACGHTQPWWSPTCANCMRPGTLRWDVPGAAIRPG